MNDILVPFDPAQPPRPAIEAALAQLAPRRCATHPDEILELDRDTIVRDFTSENRLSFRADYNVCPVCPYLTGDSSTFLRWRRSSVGEFSNCATEFSLSIHDPKNRSWFGQSGDTRRVRLRRFGSREGTIDFG
jgi:hypothetical protein